MSTRPTGGKTRRTIENVLRTLLFVGLLSLGIFILVTGPKYPDNHNAAALGVTLIGGSFLAFVGVGRP